MFGGLNTAQYNLHLESVTTESAPKRTMDLIFTLVKKPPKSEGFLAIHTIKYSVKTTLSVSLCTQTSLFPNSKFHMVVPLSFCCISAPLKQEAQKHTGFPGNWELRPNNEKKAEIHACRRPSSAHFRPSRSHVLLASVEIYYNG